MKRTLTYLVVLAAAVAVPALARAQQPGPGDDEKPAPIADPNIPDNPIPRAHATEVSKPVPRYTKADYPLELIKRPLTLVEGMVEASLEIPLATNGGNPLLTEILRGAYGITRDFEAGLTYSFGLERLNAQSGESGFEVGKAVSLDVAYTILPQYLAAQIRVPFYIDPDIFGVGLVLGVPFRIPLTDMVAIFGGRDVVRVKLSQFDADAADPAHNLGQIAFKNRGGTPEGGDINALAGVLVQIQPNLAAFGEFGLTFPEFSVDNQATELFVGITVTPRPFVDLSARTGFASLAHPGDSFILAAMVTLRL